MPAEESHVYELALKPVSRTISRLAIGFGVLFLVCSPPVILAGNWRMIIGVGMIWLAFLMICLGIHAPSHPVSRSRDSCVISSLSLCLTHFGYAWDVATLEAELQLNKTIKGTRLSAVIDFLASNGIQHVVFQCSSVTALRDILKANNAPAIAIIRTPILFDPGGWGIIAAPLQTISYWLGRLGEMGPCHAVVVHGVVHEMVAIYDPAYGTHHRVPWERLSQWLVPEAFDGSSFLAVTRHITQFTFSSEAIPAVHDPN